MDTPEKRKLSFRDIIEKNDDALAETTNTTPSHTDAPQRRTYPVSESTMPAHTGSTDSSADVRTQEPYTRPPRYSDTNPPIQQHPAAAQEYRSPIQNYTNIPAASGDDDDASDFDLLKYVGILFRRKKIILIVLMLATLFGIGSYIRTPKIFTAHSRLLFSPSYQTIVSDDQEERVSRSDASRFNTHLELLRSQTVLGRVAEQLGSSLTATELANKLKVSRGGTGAADKNDIIDIWFNSNNPQNACDVANTLCKVYVDYIKEVNVQNIDVLIVNLDEQITKVSKELETKEDMLRVFKENNRDVELTPETNTTISHLAQLEADYQATELAIIDGKQKLDGFRKQIDQQSADVIASVSYQNPYQEKLNELELELSSLSTSFSPEHYKVRMVTDEINKIKAAMKTDITREATSKTMVTNPIRQSLLQDMINTSIEQSALVAKKSAQDQLLKQLDNTLGHLPSIELQYAQLTRETESSLQVLKLLKTRYEEAKIKRDSQDSDLKILEIAQPSTIVVTGNKVSKFFITLFIGLCLGIGLAFLYEYLDQSIKEPQELERKLELPLLGLAPFIDTEKSIIENEQDAKKPIWEPFRALRTTLKHYAAKNKAKTFVVASALKSEGKSTLTSNIAIMMAMDGKKVILVDADLRRQQLYSIFNMPKNNGLSDYLVGSAELSDILKPTTYPNLTLITAGEHPQHPAELVGSQRFDLLLQELKPLADFIIFDSPALLPVSDILTMAPKMDACFMVVRAMWTPAKAAIQAKSQLERMGANLIGAILNIAQSPGYYYSNTIYSRYSYDNYEHDRSFWRELGLATEAKVKLFMLTFVHSIPRNLSSVGKTLRRMVTTKTFWVLIVTALALLVVNGYVRHSILAKQHPAPIFLGNTATPASSQPKSLEDISAASKPTTGDTGVHSNNTDTVRDTQSHWK
jgi:polysaccharide biosynthesis transport protein